MTALLSPIALAIAIGLAIVAAAGAFALRRRAVTAATILLGLAITVAMVVGIDLALSLLIRQATAHHEYNDLRWIWTSPRIWPVRVALPLAGVSAVYLGWRGGRGLGWKRRTTITAVRATGAGLLCFIAFGPALELRHVVRQQGHVAMIVDTSQSMSSRDGVTSRLAVAIAMLQRSTASLADIAATYELRWYALDQALVPTSLAALATMAAPPAPSGPASMQTHLKPAVATLAQQASDGELAGIVILSDGSDTSTADVGVALTSLRAENVPIHTLGFGTHLRDVAVSALVAEPVAFVRTVTTATATLTCHGYAPRSVVATLRLNGVPTRRKEITMCDAAATPTASSELRFEFAPQQPGALIVEIDVAPLDDEASYENNRVAAVLAVVRDKVRVLQLAGAPSWDVRAMREQLRGNPNLEVVSFYVLRHADDVAVSSDADLSLIAFPSAELFNDVLPSFDLVVLQNFDYRTDDLADYLDELAAYVQHGGGLIVLGGDLAYGSDRAGAYAGTPLGALLPFSLLPHTARDERPFRPLLTATGQTHPATRITPDREENRAIWQAGAMHDGTHVVGDLVDGAVALATHPFRLTPLGRAMPVLAARDVGRGRVLAWTTDSLWRLWFQGSEASATTGRDYQLLLQAMVQWTMREDASRLLTLRGAERLVADARDASLKAMLKSPQGEPITSAAIEVTLDQSLHRVITTDEHGMATLALADQALAPSQTPGVHVAVATTMVAGLAQTATLRWLVDAARSELTNPSPDFALLSQLSAATDGVHLIEPAELPKALRFAPAKRARVAAATNIHLWNHPLLFAALVALWLAEWLMRRRGGYL